MLGELHPRPNGRGSKYGSRDLSGHSRFFEIKLRVWTQFVPKVKDVTDDLQPKIRPLHQSNWRAHIH